MTMPDRFLRRLDMNGPVPPHRPDLGPCHLWLGPLNPEGYGTWAPPTDATPKRKRLGTTLAYRAAFEDRFGPVPPGLEVDHLCRVRACCNTDHLEAVTKSVNARRGETGHARGRQLAARTHCQNGHAFEGANLAVRKTRTGGTQRVCRRCDVIKTQRCTARRKASAA